MILVDANLLIYAINQDAPLHKQAKSWWEGVLSGTQAVGIPWVVALAFLRITTNPRIFPQPLTPEQALAYVDEWLAQPVAKLVSPGDKHWAILRNLLQQTGMAGNLTTDAHIAALAIEQGYRVYSSDNDFKRFAGVKHVNPLVMHSSGMVHETAARYG
ncbi:MAG: type II toxin-antitoxin system VapC family toxin [Thiothrix sp.]|uniref:type II toxin-antitoxin system VapC family toxin n=1 Tax=Thiothrix sp. TaxID=1032 RepID=UPI002631C340|nr:type II toxin-antitoxin system VapC family toxin [Thiothrix sp.]MDD5393637.1 type II toxin-antitoxin system VapC family toxin [Thiothrix sp.]